MTDKPDAPLSPEAAALTVLAGVMFGVMFAAVLALFVQRNALRDQVDHLERAAERGPQVVIVKGGE
jgi:hypothetical protein